MIWGAITVTLTKKALLHTTVFVSFGVVARYSIINLLLKKFHTNLLLIESIYGHLRVFYGDRTGQCVGSEW